MSVTNTVIYWAWSPIETITGANETILRWSGSKTNQNGFVSI